MARGRMIANTLGRSHKFNGLANHFHKLVYILALTHADAEGRIEADPRLVMADSFALDSEATPELVQEALVDLASVGLIQLYEVDGKAYAEFIDFHEHNTISRFKDGPDAGKPSKEAESRIPSATGERPAWATPKPDTPEPVQTSSGVGPESRGGTPPEVELEVQSKFQVEEQSTSVREHATHAPAVRQAGRAHIDYQEFVDTYNEHRGELPAVEKLTNKRRRSIATLVKEHGQAEALGLLYDATRNVSGNGFWIERGYNFDNLITVSGRVVEKAEKQRAGRSRYSEADHALAESYRQIRAAIGAGND